MADIAKAYVQIIPSAQGISGSLTNMFSGEADSAGKSVGGSLGSSIKKTLIGLGIGKALSDSVTAVFSTGKEFDTAMSQVAATMGKSVDEISDLRDTAKEMGATTAFTATQAAEGLNYLALAGYTTEQQMAALPTVLNLASAGAMDLGAASDMVTDAMSALGIEVTQSNLEDFADQLAKTSSISNTSVSQLGEALLTVGGTAKSLSGGTVEAAAALGILANNGIKASEGGTHLRNIMLSLNPTTDKAIAAWDELGVSAYDTETGALRPLEETFKDLGDAMEGMTDQEKTDILTKMFNKTDLSSVNALLSQNSTEWKKLEEAIADSGGAAETMATTQLDNVEGALTLMGSSLDGLKLSLWDTFKGTAKSAIEVFTGLISGAQSFVDEHSEQIKGFINGIGTVFTEVKDAIASGITYVREQAETEGTPINTAVTAIGDAFETVKGVVEIVVSEVIGFFQSLTESSEGESSTIQIAWEYLQTAIEYVGAVIEFVINTLKGVFGALGIDGEALRDALKKAFEDIKWVIDTTLGAVTGILDALILLLNGDFSGAWTAIKDTATDVWEKIKNKIENSPIGTLINDVKNIIEDCKSAVSNFGSKFRNAVKTAYDAVMKYVQPIIDTINAAIDAITNLGPTGVSESDRQRLSQQGGGHPVDSNGQYLYAKAYDKPYLLDTATVFGKSGNDLLVGGDRGGYKGGELIYSRNELMSDISEASGGYASAEMLGQIYAFMVEYFPMFANMQFSMDGKAVARAITPEVSAEMARMKQRGY